LYFVIARTAAGATTRQSIFTLLAFPVETTYILCNEKSVRLDAGVSASGGMILSSGTALIIKER
jgi:hypothetical protein